MRTQQCASARHLAANIIIPYFFEEEEKEDETDEIEEEKLKQVEKQQKLKTKSQRKDSGSNPNLPKSLIPNLNA